MVELIIGHTTDDSARLWVRGDKRFTRARITLKPQPAGDAISSEPLTLGRDNDYTGVAPMEGLRPNTWYRVVADFASFFGAEIFLGRHANDVVLCGHFLHSTALRR